MTICSTRSLLEGLLLLMCATKQWTEVSTFQPHGVALWQVHCLVDDVLEPYFESSAGDYNPATVTVERCSDSCRRLSFDWAGLTGGKYCLCSNRDGFRSRKNRTTCHFLCPNGSGKSPCGGRHGEVSVYKATLMARGMAGHRSANRPSSHLTNNPQHIRRAQPPRLNDDDKPIDLPGETFGLIFNPTAGLGQQAAKSGAFVVGRSDPASSARHMGEL